MKNFLGPMRGFSLVEVVVALGLFAFCIVAIVGLFGIGLAASRSVANECAAVNVAESMFGAWGAQTDYRKNVTVVGLVTNLLPLSSSGGNLIYFDGNGVQAGSKEVAAFEVNYQISFSDPGAPMPVSATVALEVKWPPGAPPDSAQTRAYTSQFVKTRL